MFWGKGEGDGKDEKFFRIGYIVGGFFIFGFKLYCRVVLVKKNYIVVVWS